MIPNEGFRPWSPKGQIHSPSLPWLVVPSTRSTVTVERFRNLRCRGGARIDDTTDPAAAPADPEAVVVRPTSKRDHSPMNMPVIL